MTVDTADLILQSLEHVREDLKTLRDDVKAGFEKVNGRLGRLEDRVTNLETWKAELDAVTQAREGEENRSHRARSENWSARQLLLGAAGLFLAAVGTGVGVVSALHLI